jgi:hypothetical protein
LIFFSYITNGHTAINGYIFLEFGQNSNPALEIVFCLTLEEGRLDDGKEIGKKCNNTIS